MNQSIHKLISNLYKTEEIHKNILVIQKITNIVKEKAINNYVYKEMYLDDKNIFSIKEIKGTLKLLYNICDYNVELIDTKLLAIEHRNVV